MLNQQKSATTLQSYFKKNEFITMKELMRLLKTANSMSVYRRLKKIDYLSSFSDAGKYYTLKSIANFDSSGLWIVNEVGFSTYGNLKQTIIHFVDDAAMGKTYRELEVQLKINLGNTLHNALLNLVKSKEIIRVILPNSNVYVYLSANTKRSKEQIINRNAIKNSMETIFPDLMIVEVLASIIRIHKIEINALEILSELKNTRNIEMTKDQVLEILKACNLKKTPDSR